MPAAHTPARRATIAGGFAAGSPAEDSARHSAGIPDTRRPQAEAAEKRAPQAVLAAGPEGL
ncbi:hypothetical protein DW189_02375 [Alistipes sp. AM16-43]|nr:hypothetical protein DW189_02375 [Alistipes sp. AM16-43]